MTIRKIFKEQYGIEIGIATYGCFDVDRVARNIKIGNYCSFAQGAVIVPRREHPLHYCSTHPFFFNSVYGWVKKSPIPNEELVIGNDVWIGQNAVISSKCGSVGNGAIIGACSFVNKDVPPYAVVAGVPARVIGYRFDSETIKLLESSKWFELSPNKLKKYVHLADNPKEFALAIKESENTDE
ncbi:MAG: CatB-related O-acetyltransferase [Lachnospiraceae bacterium]|nr:CatB-related O-acetyltransferase [Lachnospiraceae bacterium]